MEFFERYEFAEHRLRLRCSFTLIGNVLIAVSNVWLSFLKKTYSNDFAFP